MNIPKPYTGTEKYIFISYSHRDTNQVYPIIERLMANGYRVWFDGGIDPGTEWDENIADHIQRCGYFLAFMSANYLASNNCKDELNYARDLEKDRLIVYLEDVKLPSGMAMRINRLQSIFKYAYADESMFYEKLFTANNIDACLDKASSPANSDAPSLDNGVVNNRETSSNSNNTYSNPNPNPNPNFNNNSTNNSYSNPNTTQSSQGNTFKNPSSSFDFSTITNAIGSKNKYVAAILAFFLGYFGVHWFYLGKKVRGIVNLVVIFILASTPLVGLCILFTWAEAIYFLVASQEKFEKYVSKMK